MFHNVKGQREEQRASRGRTQARPYFMPVRGIKHGTVSRVRTKVVMQHECDTETIVGFEGIT